MTRTNGARTLAVLLCALLAVAATARADKGGHGKGHGHDHADHGRHGGGHGGPRFADEQRAAIQRYYFNDFARTGHCPPGLAKKNNGCTPPGHARLPWVAGRPLPADLAPLPLPPDLRHLLPPPVPGYDYGYVEGHVILYGVTTRIVVDFFAPY